MMTTMTTTTMTTSIETTEANNKWIWMSLKNLNMHNKTELQYESLWWKNTKRKDAKEQELNASEWREWKKQKKFAEMKRKRRKMSSEWMRTTKVYFFVLFSENKISIHHHSSYQFVVRAYENPFWCDRRQLCHRRCAPVDCRSTMESEAKVKLNGKCLLVHNRHDVVWHSTNARSERIVSIWFRLSSNSCVHMTRLYPLTQTHKHTHTHTCASKSNAGDTIIKLRFHFIVNRHKK